MIRNGDMWLTREISPNLLALLDSKITQPQNSLNEFNILHYSADRTKAVLEISGDLVPDCPEWMQEYGLISMSRVADHLVDLNVKELILYLNTPGGHVNGVPELADHVKRCRDKMKVTAFVDQECCSGGYWIASQANEIICTPTAMIGSIGVYIRLLKRDMSSSSYKVYYAKEGKAKLYGSPYTEISQEELDFFQGMVKDTYEAFCSAVAEGRKVDVSKVKATEAMASHAVSMPSFMYDKLMTKQDFVSTL